MKPNIILDNDIKPQAQGFTKMKESCTSLPIHLSKKI